MRELLKRFIPGRVREFIRKRRLRHVLRDYNPREISVSYSGCSLLLHFADPLAESWYGKNCPELPEITFLRTHGLRENTIVFDLGAHQGVIALVLSKIVGTKGMVVAVEALAHNARIAEININLNGAQNIKIVHGAISSSVGEVTFNNAFNGTVELEAKDRGEKVSAFTVDFMAERHGRPDLIFLDVEGFECAAMLGASEVLKSRPIFFIEVHVGAGLERLGGSVDQLIAYFTEGDYSLFIANDHSTNPVPFSRESKMLLERFYLTALPKHIDKGVIDDE